MRPVSVLMLALLLGAAAPSSADDGDTMLITLDGAFVSQSASGLAWTIGNGEIRFRVGLDESGVLVAQALERPSAADPWPLGQSPDLSFMILTRRQSPGQPGFPFVSAEADEYRGGVRLRLAFDEQLSRLRVTRSYVCYPTAAVVETWSTFEVVGTAAGVPISDLGVWQLSVPVTEVNWITGLKATAADGGRFTRRRQTLAAGGTFQLGSTTRSSELAVPTMWFGGRSTGFFGGLLWSGAWTLTADGPSPEGLTAVRLSAGATATTVRPGEPLDSPHGIFGVAAADDADVTAALTRFIRGGLRQGRPISPLVTYNTWFAYGNQIDDAGMRAEMAQAASLGVELFVVDAGWYPGGSRAEDFWTGLGTWAADSRRFPAGLRALRDHAHSLGLKFGIWVEPERVDTATVGRLGLARERYLATVGGRYNAGVRNEHADAAQICLGDGEAGQWVLSQLQRLLDEVQPDYLKWDNNYWVNCDRTSHGHGTHDGNFAHVRGLYDILETVRARYPDLIVENCSGGGNRLDLGLLRYTDAGWMDDESAPSAHVRHNAEGLGLVFPPDYLLSFVIDHEDEPIHDATDMALYFRSRMMGALGLTLIGAEFGEDDRAAIQREIALYKSVRSAAATPSFLLLTDQAGTGQSGAWDVVEWVSPDTGQALLFAYAGAGAEERTTVYPKRLVGDAQYAVLSPRGHALAQASGAELMERGVALMRLPFTAGYVLRLEPRGR